MAYNFPNYQRNADQTFGPTQRGKLYMPVNYHGRSAAYRCQKSRWSLKEHQQYEVFRISDESFMFCEQEQFLLGLLSQCTVTLGGDGEVIARFKMPQNTSDPWHGHPVKSTDINIPEDFLDFLEEHHIITPLVRVRIAKGKL